MRFNNSSKYKHYIVYQPKPFSGTLKFKSLNMCICPQTSETYDWDTSNTHTHIHKIWYNFPIPLWYYYTYWESLIMMWPIVHYTSSYYESIGVDSNRNCDHNFQRQDIILHLPLHTQDRNGDPRGCWSSTVAAVE